MNKFQIKILVAVTIFFGIYGGVPLGVDAATFVSDNITTNTTWTKAFS